MKVNRIHRVERGRFALGLFSLPVMALCWALALPSSAGAQVLYGSLIGNVKDPTGAAVPGASVFVTQKETQFSRQVTTDTAGGYNIPTIPTGTYAVKVTKSGFKAFEKTDVGVSLNTLVRVDATLELGAVTQTVEVSAAAPLLTTDRADVHHQLQAVTLENVPLPQGRNYQQLFRTIPGFNPLTNAHSIPSNPSRALRYNVNGTSASSNDVRVDGASQYNIWLPHVTAYVPSLEAIQTVNVVTNTFGVEQGLAGGSTVSVQIKSGTNNIHGSLFEYHNDNATEARRFLFETHLPRNPKDIFNQFGGVIGGPIKKDKVFYFASYEGTLASQLATKFQSLPTAEMLAGNLNASTSKIYDPATGNADGTGRIQFLASSVSTNLNYNPACLSATGCLNMIPISRLDPAVQKLLKLLPQPDVAGTGLFSSNFLAADDFKFNRHTVDAKADWNASEKFRMYGRFSYLHYSDTDPEVFGNGLGTHVSDFGGNPGHGFGYTASTTIATSYVAKPTLIFDANFGYTVMDTNSQQNRLNEKLGLDFLGIPGTNGTRLFEGGWPQFNVSGFGVLGIEDFFMPYFRHDPQQHYNVNGDWIRDTHNVRFGVDIVQLALNHTQAEFPGAFGGAQGGFRFTSGVTQLNTGGGKSSPSSNYNSFASFLLGLPDRRGKNFQVPDQFTTRTKAFGFFVGDQWQVTRNLTFNYGSRFEYFPIPGRADRGLERYDPVNNVMLVCGVGQVPHDCGVDYNKLLADPRFGFAYRAKATFVIRGGYGITSDPYDLGRPLRTNYPTLIPLTDSPISKFSSFLPAGVLTSPGNAPVPYPSGMLTPGIPAITVPNLGNGIVAIPGNISTTTLPAKFKRGYIQSWNLILEKQFRTNWIAQAGYVATRSTNQLGVLNLNVGVPGGGSASEPLIAQFNRVAQSAMAQPVANSHYDSLQTSLKHRFSRGYQIDIAYTFSKTTGIAGVGSGSDNNPRIQTPSFYFLNRGLSDLDRPHHFEGLFIAELPFGKGKRWASGGGWGSKVMGGWQVNGIFSRFSGRAFSVSTSGTSLNAPGNDQRADQVKPSVAILGGHGRGESYFDPFAFAAVNDPRFGTVAFNSLHGPRISNMDLGVYREFSISERWKLQFRANALNISNTPAYDIPGASVTSIKGTFNPDGTIQSITNLNGYTEIHDQPNLGRETGLQRIFQFGLRLSF